MKTVKSKDGTTIAYDRLGSGDVVIMVGGAMSYRQGPWLLPLFEQVAEQFTVINYDRRGRGDSGDTLPYAVEREVEDLGALIAEVGGPAHLFGLSSGAALALAAAIGGLPIGRLALYEPPFVVDDTPRPPQDAIKQLTDLSAQGRRGEAVEYFMINAMGIPAEYVAPMKQSPMWPGQEAVAHTLAYDLTILGDYSLPAGLASIRVPTLVIDGESSPPMLRNAVQAVAESIPGAQRRTLPQQGHDVSMAVLAPVLVEFFSA